MSKQKMNLTEMKKRIGNYINTCPNPECRHKQYSYTRTCEECGFNWQGCYDHFKELEK